MHLVHPSLVLDALASFLCLRLPTITLQFLFYNSNGHFLIYQRRCVHFTVLSKNLRLMYCHHRFKSDNNPSFIQNFCTQFPVSSRFSIEGLQLSNLFLTPFTLTQLANDIRVIVMLYICFASSTLLRICSAV